MVCKEWGWVACSKYLQAMSGTPEQPHICLWTWEVPGDRSSLQYRQQHKLCYLALDNHHMKSCCKGCHRLCTQTLEDIYPAHLAEKRHMSLYIFMSSTDLLKIGILHMVEDQVTTVPITLPMCSQVIVIDQSSKSCGTILSFCNLQKPTWHCA